jgi:nucleotide-binding universal stress UspA family protein
MIADPEMYRLWEKQLFQAGEEILRGAQVIAAKVAPTTPIFTQVILDSPSRVLINESQDAALLVVGDRGTGGFDRLMVGSVVTQVAAHAGCPVLVARSDTAAEADVVVGVKGAASDEAVLAFAFAEASMRGVGLTAVHAWRNLLTHGPKDMLPPVIYDIDDVADEETRVLAEALSGYADRYPEVAVKELTLRGRPAHILEEHTTGAGLVVVGPWGWRGIVGQLLGSVCQAMLHKARCPVAIVRS